MHPCVQPQLQQGLTPGGAHDMGWSLIYRNWIFSSISLCHRSLFAISACSHHLHYFGLTTVCISAPFLPAPLLAAFFTSQKYRRFLYSKANFPLRLGSTQDTSSHPRWPNLCPHGQLLLEEAQHETAADISPLPSGCCFLFSWENQFWKTRSLQATLKPCCIPAGAHW